MQNILKQGDFKKFNFPTLWTSKTPKRYKQNTVRGYLCGSKSILSNFDEEIRLMKENPTKVDYPLRFINSIINEFKKSKDHGDENL